jgi:hypothetical protein
VAAVVAVLRWWKLCAVDQLCDGRQSRWRCQDGRKYECGIVESEK